MAGDGHHGAGGHRGSGAGLFSSVGRNRSQISADDDCSPVRALLDPPLAWLGERTHRLEPVRIAVVAPAWHRACAVVATHPGLRLPAEGLPKEHRPHVTPGTRTDGWHSLVGQRGHGDNAGAAPSQQAPPGVVHGRGPRARGMTGTAQSPVETLGAEPSRPSVVDLTVPSRAPSSVGAFPVTRRKR